MQRRPHLERLDVEVGLIEAVEQHHGGRARGFKPRGQVRDAGERLRELDGHRDLYGLADAFHQLDELHFELG